MKVRDLMVTDLVTAEPLETVAQVARKMREHKVGCVLIAKGDRLLGLITDRGITVKCVAEGLSPRTTRIEEIMTREPYTVSPDVEVVDAARLFGHYRVRRLPVVEDGRWLVGILSVADVATDLKTYFEGVFHELAEWRRTGQGGGAGAAPPPSKEGGRSKRRR